MRFFKTTVALSALTAVFFFAARQGYENLNDSKTYYLNAIYARLGGHGADASRSAEAPAPRKDTAISLSTQLNQAAPGTPEAEKSAKSLLALAMEEGNAHAAFRAGSSTENATLKAVAKLIVERNAISWMAQDPLSAQTALDKVAGWPGPDLKPCPDGPTCACAQSLVNRTLGLPRSTNP